VVICSACGKPLDKVPHWLGTVKVDFICTNCPKRQIKNITQINLAKFMSPAASSETEPSLAEEDIELDEEDLE
jgi:hypothetical protein